MPAVKALDSSDLLARAVELGRELARIHADPDLHRLSRGAWVRKCIALGSFADLEALEAVRTRIASSCPYLHREIEQRAEIWRDQSQDRPGIWRGFTDGDGPMAPAYAERLMAGLGVDQCSAVAGWRCAQLRDDETFGSLDTFGQLAAMVDPLHAELVELDAAIAAELRVSALTWRAGRPCLTVAGFTVDVTDHTAPRLASAVAAMLGFRPSLAA